MTALSKPVKSRAKSGARSSKDADAKAQVRERLVRASRMLLSEEGPSALRVRRIAALAGRTTMCIYSHFGGKEGILDELYRRGFAELEQSLASVPRTKDPVADLRATLDAHRSFALDEPALYGLMFERADAAFVPSVESRVEGLRSFAVLTDAVERCVDAGLLDSDDPEATAYLLFCTAHGLVSAELTHRAWGGAVMERAASQRDAGAAFGASIDTVIRGLVRVDARGKHERRVTGSHPPDARVAAGSRRSR